MKISKKIAAMMVFVVALIVLTFQLTYTYVGNQYQQTINELTKNDADFSKLMEIDELVRNNYYGDINETTLADKTAKSYVSSLGDKFSRYMTAEEYADYKVETSGMGKGIGVRVAYSDDNKEAVIYSVLSKSPAYEAGIQKGDKLMYVDDVKVSKNGAYETAKLLHGEAGSFVKIVVSRVVGSQTREIEYTIERREMEISTIDYEMIEQEIGLIRIFSFENNTVKQFENAYNVLNKQGMSSLIIDLRNNSGGVIKSAAKILDMIVPAGEMYRTIDKEGNVEKFISDEKEISQNIIVIANAQTASASELLIAGLRDFDKALIVGEKTLGKAVLQTSYELDDGSCVLLTTKHFLPPVSESFDLVGIEPDINVTNEVTNIYFASNEEDYQLQKAISELS